MQETQETTIQEFESDGNGRYDRYADYKEIDPTFPSVPDHWEVRRLKFYAKINPSKNEVEGLDPETEVSFLPMENVSEQGEINHEETDLLEDVIDGYTYFREGDVLVAKITPCFENGKGALAEDLENGIGFGTTEFVVLRPYEQLNNEFFYYVTASNLFRKVGEGQMKGAAGQKRVPDEFFQNFPQFLPPEEEQEAIAGFLDRECAKIKKLIDDKRELIKLLEEKRATIINNAVVTGTNDNDQKDIDIDWLGSIPEHWESTSLRNTVDKFVDYRGATPEKSDSGITLVTAKNIDDGDLDFSEDHEYVTEEVYDDWMTRGYPEEGDVLITTEAPMGEVAQVQDTPVALAQRIILLKVNTDLMKKEFLKYFLDSEFNQTQLMKSQTGSTARGIQASKLKGIRVLIPPLAEQEKILEKIEKETEKIDELISEIQEGIDRLKEYRTALITNAVTGQIDVRGEV
jgi:type I restriction enzyme S subunit